MVAAAAPIVAPSGRHRASRMNPNAAAATTMRSPMPNCGFTRAATAPSAPASHHRRDPAAMTDPKSGSVPTASTWPQYGPAKMAPGCNDHRAAAVIAALRPAVRQSTRAATSAMPMSAGMLIAFTARRSSSPSNRAPRSHKTYRNAGG